jgi:SAM-dependent methyltransferase
MPAKRPPTTRRAGPPAPRRNLANRIRHALGLRQTYLVSGHRYREVSTEPMRHALSRKGAGHKDYDVTFPDGGTMRIRATARRIYADLVRPDHRLHPSLRRIETRLLPGMRVLILQAGTGHAGAWAASLVASSGAVVALDRDAESIAFAQKRYRLANSSFEVGGPDSLAGETDGAFGAVLAADAIADDEDEQATLAELWRVVAPGGFILLAGEPGPRTDVLMGRLAAIAESSGAPAPTLLPDAKDGATAAILSRPKED